MKKIVIEIRHLDSCNHSIPFNIISSKYDHDFFKRVIIREKAYVSQLYRRDVTDDYIAGCYKTLERLLNRL